MAFFISVPGEIRTPDPRLRRALLYPAELLGHCYNKDISYYISLTRKCQHLSKTYLEERRIFFPLYYRIITSEWKAEIAVVIQESHPFVYHIHEHLQLPPSIQVDNRYVPFFPLAALYSPD